ncbi:MAG: nitroreductase family protein [Candidatus Delongbacteria bacterium]|nr:nitroreductase family protein [Candidatus Delongbacteria bacterium]MCG2761091.1 nitroreductase family protein [Candidatus Delongbacteria bacterium]
MKKKLNNETIDLLLERGSLRNFSDKRIEPETLEKILAAGIQSASGGNLQPYSIIVIENPKTNIKLGDLCHQKFVGKAPVNLLFCIDWNRMKQIADTGCAPFSANNAFRHFWISFQDTIIAAQSICTAADALGLGSCYIGTVMEFLDKLIKMLGLPKGVFPVVLLPVGYPLVKIRKANKFPLEFMVHREKYQPYDNEKLFEAYMKRQNNTKYDIDDEKLKYIEQNCLETGGKALVKKCLKKIKDQGYINPVQYRFGLHYPAGVMPTRNQQFIEIMKKQGLNIFEKWEPDKEIKK